MYRGRGRFTPHTPRGSVACRVIAAYHRRKDGNDGQFASRYPHNPIPQRQQVVWHSTSWMMSLLRCNEGEVVVICGPSGSGKSTLIRCINRLEPIQSGELIVDGISVNDKKADVNKLRQEIGMVFQSFNLFPHMTALQNITLAPLKVRKWPSAQAQDVGASSRSAWACPRRPTPIPGNLSGGQQQRVAIARALAM